MASSPGVVVELSALRRIKRHPISKHPGTIAIHPRRCTSMPARSALTSALFGAALMGTALLGSAPLDAQQVPPANPLDAVPDKMPFDIPYGAPISLERAAAAIAATLAGAKKHD